MALTLHKLAVSSVGLGDRAGLDGGRLVVDGAALRDLLLARDERLTEVRLALAERLRGVRFGSCP